MYKVGDRVRIINDLEEGNFYGSPEDVIDDMLEYAGTDTEITEDCENGTYRLSCDDGDWCWPEKTLIPYAETNGDKIRNMTDDELAVIIMCPYDKERDTCGYKGSCLDCCLEWIKKIAE